MIVGMAGRVLRGAGLAALLLGGIVSGIAAVAVPTGYAFAQSASGVVVEGNRRVEADTDPFLLPRAPAPPRSTRG